MGEVSRVNGVPLKIEELYDGIERPKKDVSTALRIRKDIFDFYKENLDLFNNATDLITVDRTGTHLYHSFIDSINVDSEFIEHKLSSPSDVPIIIDRMVVPSPFVFFKNFLKRFLRYGMGVERSAIILLDCINRGNEISDLVEIFKESHIKITAVVAYLSNESTLERLMSDDLFTDVPLYSIEVANNTKKFKEINYKLLVHKHSQNTPSDPEHRFGKYNITPKIDKDGIYKMFSNIEKIFCNDCENIDFDQNWDPIEANPDVHSKFTVELFGESKNSIKFVKEVFNERGLVIEDGCIERAQIRVKIDDNYPDSIRFTVMPFVSPFGNFKGCNLENEDDCQVRKFKDKKNKDHIQDIRNNRCPNCIERAIARALLKNVEEFIIQELREEDPIVIHESGPEYI